MLILSWSMKLFCGSSPNKTNTDQCVSRSHAQPLQVTFTLAWMSALCLKTLLRQLNKCPLFGLREQIKALQAEAHVKPQVIKVEPQVIFDLVSSEFITFAVRCSLHIYASIKSTCLSVILVQTRTPSLLSALYNHILFSFFIFEFIQVITPLTCSVLTDSQGFLLSNWK